MTTATMSAADGRGPSVAPVGRLTVLYDENCPLCRHVRAWLARQPAYVPLEFVPAGSDAARQRYPDLDHGRTLREITVVGDSGQVYEGTAAWVVCLWALRQYRTASHRFASPGGAKLARGMVLTAARWREYTATNWPGNPARPAVQGAAGRTGAGPPAAMGDRPRTVLHWERTPAPSRTVTSAPAACGDGCATPDR